MKNHVALLCDHLGSIVRAAVRSTRIEEFHARSTEVIRDVLLGGTSVAEVLERLLRSLPIGVGGTPAEPLSARLPGKK